MSYSMTGDTTAEHDPANSTLRPRPSKPARFSVTDITDNQRKRSNRDVRTRPNGDHQLTASDSKAPSAIDDPRSTESGSPQGRLESLKRKFTRSRQSSGFLLDRVSSTGRRRNASSSSRPVNGDAGTASLRNTQLADGIDDDNEPQRVGISNDLGLEGVVDSKLSREIRVTPQSQRSSRLIHHDAPDYSTTRSPSTQTPPRISTEQAAWRSSGDRSRTSSTAIDPAQLVRMALNLSESRRMQLDPGHLPSIAVSPESRPVSASYSKPRTLHSGSSQDNIRDERRSLPRPATGSRSSASQGKESQKQGPSPISSSRNSGIIATEPSADYIFSPATIERAQRAKKYIELSTEYRRLLQVLTPLKPCVQPDGKKVPCELGRAYNPLQYIRNRRARIHNNAEFDSGADGWADPVHVHNWVDAVEYEARQPGYVADDVVLLPHWSSGVSKPTNPQSEDAKSRQQATNFVKKEIRSQRLDWKFNPSDLLEDAYWLEQNHHKALIQSKQGLTIFHNFTRPIKAIQEHRSRAGTGASTYSEASYISEDEQNALERTTSPSSLKYGSQEDLGKSKNHHHLHGTGRMKRSLFRKRAKSDSLSSDDGTADESTGKDKYKSGQARPRANIGPLEKHMQAMIEQEYKNELQSPKSPASPLSTLDSPDSSRRHGISGESFPRQSDAARRPEEEPGLFGGPLPSKRPSNGDTKNSVPRISVERYEDDQPLHGELLPDGTKWQSVPRADPPMASNTQGNKRRQTRLGFWGRPKSKAENRIGVTDFARSIGDEGSFSPQYGSEWESGTDSFTRVPTATTEGRQSYESDLVNETNESGSWNGKSASPTSKGRFFKGGRIGDLVRNEGSAASSIVFKRQPPRRPSPDKWKGLMPSDVDEATDRRSRPRPLSRDREADFKALSRNRRSSSAGGSGSTSSPQYHIKNLPTFQSRDVSEPHSRASSKDHVSRQQEERRTQRQNSRLRSISPVNLDTNELGSSSRDLSRYNTLEPPLEAIDRRQSYGFGQWAGSDAGVRAADKRLNAVMSDNGESDRHQPSKSLSQLGPRPNMISSPTGGKGWSIDKLKGTDKKAQSKILVVTRKDVAQLQTLLVSAGTKAQTIARRADEPRDEVTNFLKEAFETAGQDVTKLGKMSVRQAHVMAAQLISNHLSRTLHDFDASVIRFRAETCQRLTDRIDDLREKATSDLMPKVQSVGGEADAFVARLTTTHTLAIRQVMDSVEQMLRKRRRRLRYVQRQLFTLLEWTLVALMWWIWLVVFVLRIFRGILTGAFKAIRWLLWL